jgi:hypothetical protein
MMTKIPDVAYIMLVAACTGASPATEERAAMNTEGTAPSSSSNAETDTVLAARGIDSVVLRRTPSNAHIVWTSGQTRWESGPTYGANPMVLLQDINDDGELDLFWTLHYEEIVAGMLLFADGSGARTAFVTGGETCRVPELQDVNGDGRVDVVTFTPGALPWDECSGDALAQSCQEAYPTEWADAWIQVADTFKVVPALAQSYYSDRAQRYEDAARELRARLESELRTTAPPRCDLNVAAALDSMAVRARAQVAER